MVSMGSRSNISRAARERRLIRIWYTSSDGEVSIRDTEPYEIRDGKYWGYCLDRGSIRQFSLEGITKTQVLKETYVPRWPVKL